MTDRRNEFPGYAYPEGRMTADYPSQLKAYLKHLAGEGGDEIVIKVVKRRSQRSTEQNSYWWAVVIPLLSEHCGYTHDEMHEALKAKFLSQEDLTRGLVKIGSTAKLEPGPFAELVDKVILWAAEDLGVVIPLPDKRWRQKGKAA